MPTSRNSGTMLTLGVAPPSFAGLLPWPRPLLRSLRRMGGGCFASTANSYGILAPVVSFEMFKISRYLPDEPDEPDDTHLGILLRCSAHLGHVICFENPYQCLKKLCLVVPAPLTLMYQLGYIGEAGALDRLTLNERRYVSPRNSAPSSASCAETALS